MMMKKEEQVKDIMEYKHIEDFECVDLEKLFSEYRQWLKKERHRKKCTNDKKIRRNKKNEQRGLPTTNERNERRTHNDY